MKRLVLAICALCLTLNYVKAQSEDSNEEVTLQSGLNIEYQAIENAFGLGFNCVMNHFALNFSWIEGENNSYIEKNNAWKLGVGYNQRYWLNNSVYVEGAAGVQYTHAKVKYEGNEESDGNFGLFVTPKIGVKLFTWDEIDWGIQAGYRWDFNKFKFSKEYTADYFTIGIVGLF